MNAAVAYALNRATNSEIAAHLRACDRVFVPPLSERVVIDDYASKITQRATRFEAWAGEELAGLAAAYCDDPGLGVAFVTNVSVLPEWQGRGVAVQLLDICRSHIGAMGFPRIDLEVAMENHAALALYHRCGFDVHERTGSTIRMTLDLERMPE
jgi:ribosomal protein S18 acetylase RimI-like enzyme